MGEIVQLDRWRRRRDATPRADDVVAEPGAERSSTELQRLDEAVRRLQPLVSRALDRGRLREPIETELLAIMGELAVGLVGEAAVRAERLARQIGSANG